MKYFGGCDVGSTYTKAVILDETGKIVADTTIRSKINSEQSAVAAMAEVCEKAGLKDSKDLSYLIGTGYGRNKVPFADENISEISCHAMGVHVTDPSVKAIIDIGGQDVKGISIDTDGTVKNFAMNDKCAAGTGRFLDVMARVLEVKVEELGDLGDKSTKEVGISSTCTVFAESEVISQLAMGTNKCDIIHGIHKSVAGRVSGLCHRIGVRDDVVMTGGVAQNHGIVKALQEQLGHEIHTTPLTQYNGALGAALFAYQKALKNK